MLPVSRNIQIYKGDSFALSFRLRSRDVNGDPSDYVDLSGCTAKAQIRETEDSSSIIAEFDAEVPTQTGTDLGRVNLSLEPAVTGAAGFIAGKWDVQLTFPDGAVKTYLNGSVTVIKEVTRV